MLQHIYRIAAHPRIEMTMLTNYNAENERWANRLADMIAQLNDSDLVRPLEAGWTVSAVLAHLVFWDMRIITLLEKWKADGAVGPSEIDADVINEVSRQLFLHLPPRVVASLAVEWSRKANAAIAALDQRAAAEIIAKAPNVRLDRTHHRRAHIEEIEAALGL